MAVCYLFRLTNTVSNLLNILNGSNNSWDLFGFLHKKDCFWFQMFFLFIIRCVWPGRLTDSQGLPTKNDFSFYIFYIFSGITQICQQAMKLSVVIACCFWDSLHWWCQKIQLMHKSNGISWSLMLFFSFVLCSQDTALKINPAKPGLYLDSVKSCLLK